MFNRGLQKMGLLNQVPESYKDRLAAVYYQTVQINLKLMAAAEELLCDSARMGIHPLILQGMSLQGDVYKDPGVRPMSDIDLLIAPSSVDRFSKLLARLGYHQDPLYPGSWERDATNLDIHTDLFWADRLKSRKWLTPISDNVFVERAEAFLIRSATAKRLNSVDQVLYLGMHVLKHNVDRLIWLVDIARLLERMSKAKTDALVARAGSVGLSRQMGNVGFLINRLLGIRSALLPPTGAIDPLTSRLLRCRDHNTALPSWSPLVLFSAGKGARIAAAMIREMVFPEPRVLRQVFADRPTASPWRLYIYRIGQMLGMRR